MTPTPTSADAMKRLLDTLETWVKLGGALAALWLFIRRVLKPFIEWRRKSLAILIKEILKDELNRLDSVGAREDEVFRLLGRVLARQDEFFKDVDAFILIATHNTERIDEVNDLLDASGYASERRSGEDRRNVEGQMQQLLERRRLRRRLQTDDIRRETLVDLHAVQRNEALDVRARRTATDTDEPHEEADL